MYKTKQKLIWIKTENPPPPLPMTQIKEVSHELKNKVRHCILYSGYSTAVDLKK